MPDLLSEIVDYLDENYEPGAARRLAENKLIASMALQGAGGKDWKSIIDKIAIFNGIAKVKKQ